MIARKFVNWDVPALDDLKESTAYQLRTKLNRGQALSREEKNWLTEHVNSNSYSKWGIPLRGWMFSFNDVLKRFIVKQYDAWQEYTAIDKTSLREYLFGRIQEIVEV